MATIEYSVAGQQIVVTKDEKLVENTIGIYTVGFTFDAASWGDFTQKTAVFVHEDYPDIPPYEVPIDDGEAPIPAAVLKYGNIMIGVYGSTQTQQYPTIWAPAKRVWPGAGPGVEPPEDPVFGMVVRTAPQELTEEQQEIARTNIGAAPEVIPDSTPGNITIIGSNNNIEDGGHKFSDAFPVESASGSIVTIEDGADGIPIKSMTVHISGGVTKADVTQKSKNLFNEDDKLDKTGISNQEATLGQWTTTTTYACSNYIDVTGIAEVTIRVMKTATGGAIFRVCGYNSSHVAIEMPIDTTFSGTGERVRTVDVSNYTYIAVQFSRSSFNNGNTWWITATSKTYEITFPTAAGTVTEGELTIYGDGTGVLTVGASEYPITAEVIKTLFGENTFWADTGNIAVEYHADPTIFVEEKTKAIKQSIAPVEDGYTASQAYAVGAFLYVGDTLYKVTSAISSGATITPNTNVTATTVAEQLMALA